MPDAPAGETSQSPEGSLSAFLPLTSILGQELDI